jgi:DNA-binding response OmpR family regulator
MVVPATADSRPKVLVVDDEEPILDLVVGYADREGWDTRTALDGLIALELVRSWQPDVVILDLMLPGLGGLEVCAQLRQFSDAYVLMLTARSEEIDRVVGLTVGADDYLTKPFSPRELVARVKAVLRRPRRAPEPAVLPLAAGLEVDEPRRLVSVDGRRIELTAIEFNVLAALVRSPGVVLSRGEIYDRVWGGEFVGDDHLVDVHVANVRRKLGDDPASPRFIETLRGVGYRAREASD